ncbi:hypothetical protein FRC09_018366 [Ceratobasidium sp. 395]|nr:hypothetical protein FRC09_018366 [Ceratobasidium sp. 395]
MSARSKPPTGEDKLKMLETQYPLRANKQAHADSSDDEIPGPIVEVLRVVVSRNVSLNDSSASLVRLNTESKEEELANAFSEGTTIAASDGTSKAATEDDDNILEVARSEIGSTVSTAPVKHRDKTIEKRQAMPPEEELVGCVQQIKASGMEWYKTFELPTVEEADHLKYILFECKNCGENVKRKIRYTTTLRLKYHIQNCKGKQTAIFENYGIFGGSLMPSAYDVRKTVALWCAESARPFTIVQDPQFQRLMPPTTRKLLPSWVTKDIKIMLKNSRGVFHLALDMCTAPNTANLMGIVLYRQVEAPITRELTVKRFVLECLAYNKDHTGEELAKVLYGVLQKFEIEDRDAWLPFRQERKRLTAAAKAQQFDEEEAEEQEVDYGADDEDINPDDDGTVPSAILDIDNDGFEKEELELDGIDVPKIMPGSSDALEADCAYGVVIKLCIFSKKIHFSRPVKRIFKEECEKEDVKRPDNVHRKQLIRFTSTGLQLEDGDRRSQLCDLTTQKRLGVPPHQRLKKDDQKVIKLLIGVLKPLRIVTEVMSRAEVPLIADVIIHFDALNNEYGQMAANSSKPLYIQKAAEAARRKLDKYYKKTDESKMYRLSLVLHPSIRVAYLERAKWEKDWIDEAVNLTERVWKAHYKLQPKAASEQPAAPVSDFGYSSWMTRTMAEDAASDEPENHDNPVCKFVYGKRLWDTSKQPPGLLNPIAW